VVVDQLISGLSITMNNQWRVWSL